VSIYSNTETLSLAMSTLAIWCHVVRSRDFSAPNAGTARSLLTYVRPRNHFILDLELWP